MAPKHPDGDRNFDGLVNRFRRNIYDSPKGQLRLAVLKQDFDEFVVNDGLSVLDVGAGEGRWSCELARAGHQVTLTDLSEEMLAASRQWFADQPDCAQLRERVAWVPCPLQKLNEQIHGDFDLVMCHAVLEWVEDPSTAIETLCSKVRPGGLLSLLYYNVNGLIYKNLLRGNYVKVANQDFRGFRGSLTPINPLAPGQVRELCKAAGLTILCESGVRVFHDYILDRTIRDQRLAEAFAMELRFSRQLPYRDLGRYVHILCRKGC